MWQVIYILKVLGTLVLTTLLLIVLTYHIEASSSIVCCKFPYFDFEFLQRDYAFNVIGIHDCLLLKIKYSLALLCKSFVRMSKWLHSRFINYNYSWCWWQASSFIIKISRELPRRTPQKVIKIISNYPLA